MVSITSNPQQRTFIPPLVPPTKTSLRIPSQYLEGYFPNLEARVSSASDAEKEECFRVLDEWKSLGGIVPRDTVTSPAGCLIALTLPDADPAKIVAGCALDVVAFLIDDHMDDDYPAIVENYMPTERTRDERKDLTKDQVVKLNQMKAKYYTKLIEDDEEAIGYIEGWEQWHRAGLESDNLEAWEFRNFDEFMDARLNNIGADSYAALLPYCYDLALSDADQEKLVPINLIVYQGGALINDYYSVEREWAAHAALKKPDYPNSSLFVIMRFHDVTLGEAKEILKEKYYQIERDYLRERQRLVDENGLDSVCGQFASHLQYVMSGLAVFSMHNPRYHLTPEDTQYCPRPEQKLRDLPGWRPGNLMSLPNKTNDVTNGHQDGSGSLKPLHSSNGVNGKHQAKSWLSPYSTLSDEVVLEPFKYIQSLPSKKIRKFAIEALDYWYRVPQRSLDIILNVIDILHSSSLIIDDIEDDSTLRRGRPAAHMIYGTPQAINAANFLFVKALEEVKKLSSVSIDIYSGSSLRVS
ncbi:hypothetical protein ABW21_db0206335 [Orbilia brochopaga]|nr:hypothetical protein ABW21_db0206335 [Drechslerella brochopaga]